MPGMITLWCILKGDSSLFKVEIAPEKSVADLKELIHGKAVKPDCWLPGGGKAGQGPHQKKQPASDQAANEENFAFM
jgi:hypothetical protein